MQGDDQEPLVALSYWQELTESEFLQRGFAALPEAGKGLAGRLHDRMPPASTLARGRIRSCQSTPMNDVLAVREPHVPLRTLRSSKRLRAPRMDAP